MIKNGVLKSQLSCPPGCESPFLHPPQERGDSQDSQGEGTQVLLGIQGVSSATWLDNHGVWGFRNSDKLAGQSGRAQRVFSDALELTLLPKGLRPFTCEDQYESVFTSVFPTGHFPDSLLVPGN